MGYGDEMEVGREGLEGVFFYRINTMDRIYRRDGILGGEGRIGVVGAAGV
jgi:hypothetical protein